MKIKHKIITALTASFTAVALGSCIYNSTVLFNDSIHNQYAFQDQYLKLLEDSLNKQTFDLDEPEFAKIKNLIVKNQKNAYDYFILVNDKQDIENFAAFKYFIDANSVNNRLYEIDEKLPASEDCYTMLNVPKDNEETLDKYFADVGIKLDKFWCQTVNDKKVVGYTIENQDDKKYLYVEKIRSNQTFMPHSTDEFIRTANLTQTIDSGKYTLAILDSAFNLIESNDSAFNPQQLDKASLLKANDGSTVRLEITNGKVSLASIKYLPKFNMYAVVETPKGRSIIKLIWSDFIVVSLSVISLILLVTIILSSFKKMVGELTQTRKALEYMSHNVLSDREVITKVTEKLDPRSFTFKELSKLAIAAKNLSRAISESVESKIHELINKQDTLLNNAVTKKHNELMQNMHASCIPDGSDMPTSKFLDIASFMIPANVGQKDFYDIFRVDKDNIGIVIGSTSTPGIDANNVTNICINFIRKSLGIDGRSPGQTVTDLNKILMVKEHKDLNVSILVMILSEFTGNYIYSIAGRELPIQSDEYKVSYIEPKSIQQELCTDKDLVYIDSNGKLTYGDVLTFVGNGIYNTVNIDKEKFTPSSLLDLCLKNQSKNATDQLIAIYKQNKQFGDAADNDLDVLSIVVKRNSNNKEFAHSQSVTDDEIIRAKAEAEDFSGITIEDGDISKLGKSDPIQPDNNGSE